MLAGANIRHIPAVPVVACIHPHKVPLFVFLFETYDGARLVEQTRTKSFFPAQLFSIAFATDSTGVVLFTSHETEQ
jgi:hypothetical protein